jgi:hypothetical protein
MSRGAIVSRSSLLEALESRLLLSFDPTAQEQQLLELVNRMRTNPGPELDLILNANDPNVSSDMFSFGVNESTLRTQWAALQAVPPVAWNESLYYAARGHSQTMLKYRKQAHQVIVKATSTTPAFKELDLRPRISAQGYTDNSYLGENVYAAAQSVLHAHAAFAVDWGGTPPPLGTGIQNPPGHRDTIMDDITDVNGNPVALHYREVGISMLHGATGPDGFGPWFVTEDFGGPVNPGNPYIVGSIFQDLNSNGFYDAGEGLGGIDVHIVGTGGSFNTYTMTAGGYQVRVPPGTYTITVSAGMLSPQTVNDVVIGNDNVMADFNGAPAPDVVNPSAKLVTPPAVTASGRTSYSVIVDYADNRLLKASTLGTGDILVYNTRGFKQVATLKSRSVSTNSRSIRAIYTFTPPGGSWDSADNSRYSIKLMPSQVKDIFGNSATSKVLGTFMASIPKGAAVRSIASMAALSEVARPTVATPATGSLNPLGAFSTQRISDVFGVQRNLLA